MWFIVDLEPLFKVLGSRNFPRFLLWGNGLLLDPTRAFFLFGNKLSGHGTYSPGQNIANGSKAVRHLNEIFSSLLVDVNMWQ